MADEQSTPDASVDLDGVTQHLASLRREIEARPSAALLNAAHVTLAAGDEALDQDELRRAALEFATAAFLVEAARKKVAGSG